MPPSPNDGATESHPEAAATTPPAPPPSRGGLRKIFWVAAFALVLLAVAALGTTGYLAQQELRRRLDRLQADLDAAHQQLSQERDRAQNFESTLGRVHELAGELGESLRELQTLTAPKSIASSRPEAAPAPSAPGKAKPPAPAASREEAVAEKPTPEAKEVTPAAEPAATEKTADQEPAVEPPPPGPGPQPGEPKAGSEPGEVVPEQNAKASPVASPPGALAKELDEMPSVLELDPDAGRVGSQTLLAPGDVAPEAPVLPPTSSRTGERAEELSESAHKAPDAE
jgi:hypothetical protein